jgi:hypothetical protein
VAIASSIYFIGSTLNGSMIMAKTRIGDLIRLDPEYHGGMDDLAVVLSIEESMQTVPRELTIHVQGVDGGLDRVYEDEVEVVSEVLHKQG